MRMVDYETTANRTTEELPPLNRRLTGGLLHTNRFSFELDLIKLIRRRLSRSREH